MPRSPHWPRGSWLGIVAFLVLGDGGMGTGGGGRPALASAQEPAAAQGITAAHNAARAAVQPPAREPIPPLTWSPSLAATAQAWADQCHFQHSKKKGLGENIFASSGQATPEEVVESWVSEKKSYNYARNRCRRGECGHYTQVVWARSLRVGCAAAKCTANSPFGRGPWQFWVCNYDPPGNYIGERPY